MFAFITDIGNNMRKWAGILSFSAGLMVSSHALSQGCVIARGGGGSILIGGNNFLKAGDWQIGTAYRYFHSDRHFIGDQEQRQRQREDTQVENYSNFIDLNVTYAVNSQLWLNFTLPFVSHDRSSLYEHDRIHRFSTSSGGLADIRVSGTYWLFDPEEYDHGNLSLGLGFKAPSGNYKATDVFMRPTGPQERYVDSSIQPGDGGWGATLEMQGFYAFTGTLSGYVNGFYLINPRERMVTGFSVPDGYAGRLGLNYVVWPTQGFSLILGGRIEGVPPTDVFGGNLGFRRSGYSVSIEPGISWTKGRYFVTVTTPVAVYRNRQQSYPESLVGRHGDAAFADYSINFAFSVRI